MSMNRRRFTKSLLGSFALPLRALTVGASSGVQTMRRGDVFNVRHFGARGAGMTDDSLAFRAALDAAAPNRGTVRVPAGRYVVPRTLRIASGVTLHGEGPGTV